MSPLILFLLANAGAEVVALPVDLDANGADDIGEYLLARRSTKWQYLRPYSLQVQMHYASFSHHQNLSINI